MMVEEVVEEEVEGRVDGALTDEEHAVLAHIVVDPVAWWEHVRSRDGKDGKHVINAEAALSAKVSRVKPEYDDLSGAEGRRLETIADGEKAASEPVLVEDHLERQRLARIAAGEAATLIAPIVYQTRAERDEAEVAALLPDPVEE
jgi:hypothetical protein